MAPGFATASSHSLAFSFSTPPYHRRLTSLLLSALRDDCRDANYLMKWLSVSQTYDHDRLGGRRVSRGKGGYNRHHSVRHEEAGSIGRRIEGRGRGRLARGASG